jgi:hypothetical protein
VPEHGIRVAVHAGGRSAQYRMDGFRLAPCCVRDGAGICCPDAPAASGRRAGRAFDGCALTTSHEVPECPR